MARARLETEHDRTAQIMATVINMLRDPRRSRHVKPENLNPYRSDRRASPQAAVGIEALRIFLPPEASGAPGVRP
jgi:hypothetical protein